MSATTAPDTVSVSSAADALKIVPHPHPALRRKAQPVTEINAALRRHVSEMFELMYAHEGIGLAATQVARPWRLFVANPTGDAEEKDQEQVFINPEIVRRTGSETAEEGCLSLPQLFGDVRRAQRIVVEAFDLNGKLFAMDLEDLPARVVLHEFDHLDGVMFPDRMTPAEKAKAAPKLADFEHAWTKAQKNGEIPSNRALLKEFEAFKL
ncbi:peptide deformylase [Alienimonas californiensis]|uniref:Peptide deformylase n=1 Tax=Alienimonas californiensis TaxID=2527989 RepID=A0A517P992_9PLAN|nr:peptide deformylase [Alienimonas californiensis]QDT15925.1 Peptide deformylase [Alienimonas californiensis]